MKPKAFRVNREVGPGSTHYALSPSDYGPLDSLNVSWIIVSCYKELGWFFPWKLTSNPWNLPSDRGVFVGTQSSLPIWWTLNKTLDNKDPVNFPGQERSEYCHTSTLGRDQALRMMEAVHLELSQPVPGIPRCLSGKESACQWKRCKRPGFKPWIGKILWRRKWHSNRGTTPVCLPGESHAQGSLAGYSPWGRKELDINELLSTYTETEPYVPILWAASKVNPSALIKLWL